MEIDREIKKILDQADRAAGVLEISGNLAGRVRQLAQRRRTTRIVTTAAVAVLIVAVAVSFYIVNNKPGSVNTPPTAVVQQDNATEESPVPVAQLQRELVQLRAEIDMRMTLVEEMIARQEQREKMAQLRRRLAAIPDPIEEINRQIEQAALTITYQADRKYDKLNLKQSAIEDYHRVIKLYPHTHWAQHARKKLKQIESQQKGIQL